MRSGAKVRNIFIAFIAVLSLLASAAPAHAYNQQSMSTGNCSGFAQSNFDYLWAQTFHGDSDCSSVRVRLYECDILGACRYTSYKYGLTSAVRYASPNYQNYFSNHTLYRPGGYYDHISLLSG